jgi:hypothetical protein
MRTLVIAVLISWTAAAQEAPPPASVSSAALDFQRAPPDNNAVQRGKGAMLLTLGSIMIPISASLLGTSAILWEGYNSNCSYGCDKYAGNLAGGLVLDIVGVAVFAGGATMLSLGAQKYVEHKKPAPRFAFTGNGFTF